MHRRMGAIAVALTALLANVAVGDNVLSAQTSASTSCAERPRQDTAPPRLESYQPINPKRLVDTRDSTGGVSGTLGAGCTLQLQVSASDVPADAAAVTISLTVVTADRGYFTVFPCAAGNPGTSNVNARGGGMATPGLVVSALDADRRICVYSSHGGDVIVDLNGWWSSTGPNRHSAVQPFRAYDTRELAGAARVRAGEVRGIPLAGTAVPVGAAAAAVNLTVVGADAPGHIVIFPCGFSPPLASNLNFLATEARAVAAIVGLDGAGGLCVQPSTDVHVIIDVNGYYGAAPPFGVTSGLQPLAGVRIADTRTGQGPWNQPFAADTIRSIRPLDGTGVTPTATSVLLNIVTTNTSAPGWVAAFPCGSQVPLVSSVNFWGPGEAMNLVPVKLSNDGEVCIRASAPADVVIDVYGTIAPRPGVFAERLSFGSRRAVPELTGDGTDYGVYCDAGTTNVDVELDLVPGATARINGVTVAEGTTSVAVPQDGLFTVDLRWSGTTQRYHFRCLPPDFPQLVVERTGSTQPGWHLTTLGVSNADATPFLVIFDHRGAPVWYKRAATQVLDLKRLSNGTLAFTPLLGGAFGIDPERGYVITNLAGALLAERTTDDPAALPVDHHDYVELPGGGWALISYPLVRNQDLTALGAGYFADESIVDGTIQELDSSGAEVWRWDTSDHFDYTEATFPQRFALYPAEPHGGEVDIWHLNAIQRVADGDYVVSARHLDAIFRVDRDTGNVAWTLGGKPTVPNRLTIVGDPLDGPRRPHHATLAGDVLTLFDNRAGTNQPARAVAYRIDESAMTATLLWQVTEPLGRASFGLGSAQVTPDGSRLIGWGGLQPMFEEYAPSGQRLLRITQPDGLTSYRILKYAPNAFDVAQLRASAGGDVTLPGG